MKQPSSDDDGTVLFGRDTSLFLFKALGKILYCKRKYCLAVSLFFLSVILLSFVF